ncbi:MAG: DUF6476 family protein [Pseudomonadota bacterium]
MSEPDTGPEPPEPPRIRLLRRLVTALTLTLTVGMIVIVGLMIWRLGPATPMPALPEAIALPEGERLTGYAQNPEWTVLITTDAADTQRLHLVRAGTTDIHQTVTVDH